MCRFYNQPLYLDWAIRTQELTLDRDPDKWIYFTTYTTNGLRVKIENGRSQLLPIEVPKDVDEIVVDYSALITLNQLGLLKKVQKCFKKIYYPHILDVVWANDQPHFTYHQKSKAETYKKLKRRLDLGEIKRIAAPEPQSKGTTSQRALSTNGTFALRFWRRRPTWMPLWKRKISRGSNTYRCFASPKWSNGFSAGERSVKNSSDPS